VCFETNAQPDYLDYLGHCNYISHRQDRGWKWNDGFFAGYFSDILVDITIAKKGRIVDKKERARVEAGQTEKWKANILAMRT